MCLVYMWTMQKLYQKRKNRSIFDSLNIHQRIMLSLIFRIDWWMEIDFGALRFYIYIYGYIHSGKNFFLSFGPLFFSHILLCILPLDKIERDRSNWVDLRTRKSQSNRSTIRLIDFSMRKRWRNPNFLPFQCVLKRQKSKSIYVNIQKETHTNFRWKIPIYIHKHFRINII